MRAAVLNGAHAVYFGVEGFNARYRATNFQLDELPEVMAYLHQHNVRGYITFNILIFSDELEAAVKQITAMAEAGVDGVIVQDLGLARLLQEMVPDMPVHGSTQMTLTEPLGVRFVAERLGVRRVVLAREMSIEEIKKTHEQAPVPVEAFVHGALCVAYSGQCLTSESLGGRSANRGMCAQACRLPYELVVDGDTRDIGDVQYLVSPKDLAAYDLVPQMLEAGIKSFKIEGRLKSPHYVAAATQTYRAALDAAMNNTPFTLTDEQAADLAQSFSRGFSNGFLDGVNHQALVEGRSPKKRGIKIGTVESVEFDGLVIQFTPEAQKTSALRPGAGVVFDEGHPDQDEQGGRVYTVEPQRHGRAFVSFGRDDIDLSVISEGAIVWKTDDPTTRKRLEQSYKKDTVVDRTPINFTVHAAPGKPLEIQAAGNGGLAASVFSETTLETAMKRPLTHAVLTDKLSRLGNTPFDLGSVSLIGPNGPCDESPAMVPVSLLNDLRRQLVDALGEQRVLRHAIKNTNALADLRTESSNLSTNSAGTDIGTTTEFVALCRTLEQVEHALAWAPPEGCSSLSMLYVDFEDVRRYPLAVQRANAASVPIAVGTMRVLKPQEHGYLKHILSCKPDAVLVRNLASIIYLHEHAPGLPLIADYSLNIANELTAAVFAAEGVQRMVPSYDLSWPQMLAMMNHFDPVFFEVVVHQHMPMFHMEHCVFAHTLSNGADYKTCGRPCEEHQVALRDRVGIEHPLLPDNGCRNTLYNAQAQSAAEYIPRMLDAGLRRFRVELLTQDNERDVHDLLTRYARVIAGQDNGQTTWRGLNVLNQLGVTRGTLQNN